MARSEHEVMEALTAHLSDLSGCVREGIDAFAADHKELRHKQTPRSESSLINDYILHEVRRRFSSKAGVNILKRRGSYLLNIGGLVLVKFKKLDRRKGASFIPTRAATRFAAQLSIETGERLTHLFVGYVRDQVELLNSEAWIMCPAAGRILAVRLGACPAATAPAPSYRPGPASSAPPRDAEEEDHRP